METKRDERKLDPEFKKRWVEALRSGVYKQGSTLLYNYSSDSYCCLGVACIVAGYPKNELPRLAGKEWISELVNDIPKVLRGNGTNNPIAENLAHMNDDGKSFSQIADYIEKNL